MRAYDDATEREIVRRYEAGEKSTALAKEYHIHRYTVVTIANRYGATMQQSGNHGTRYCTGAVIHDWNAGLDPERIARVYGFASVGALYSWLYHRRKSGMRVVNRKPRLTASEATTAGCILQSKGDV